MTAEELVYAEWLNVFGSDMEPPEVTEALQGLHDRAEASVAGTEEG